MGKCRNHPERETSYVCLKHGYFLCEACLACGDPKLYCTNRPSCIIHFLTRRKNKAADAAGIESASNL
jgi:hypothetical protein